MLRDTNFGRRVIGALALGAFVALVNYVLDISFVRLGIAPATTALNDLIIGAAAGSFAYFWMSRQIAKNEETLSSQKLMEETVQSERKRIALELHDTVCQAQAAAIMHLECAGDSLDGNSEAREHVFRALQLVRESMTEMRCALWDLFPEELQKIHLKGAMEHLLKDLVAGNGLTARFSLEGMIRPLPPEIEKVLLRISQEALSNVVKHAQAREVQVELFLDSQRARLCVKDDGLGFEPQEDGGSFGLTSMQDRAKALGGVWTIHSEPGRGTEVQASIPIPPTIN